MIQRKVFSTHRPFYASRTRHHWTPDTRAEEVLEFINSLGDRFVSVSEVVWEEYYRYIVYYRGDKDETL